MKKFQILTKVKLLSRLQCKTRKKIMGVKGEGHSKEGIFFVNANKNLALSLATHRNFNPKSVGFPYEIRLQRSPKFEHYCRHLNST